MAKMNFWTWLFLLIGFGFWIFKTLAIFYQFFQYWDIKSFFNQALHVDDHELDSVTWREVQRRLVAAQKDHMMCIHKDQLTDLDIYHRILRFKNYLVAMANKDLLPIRISLPCLPSFVFLSHGLKFNLEWLFFKVCTCHDFCCFHPYNIKTFRVRGQPLTSGTSKMTIRNCPRKKS